MDIDAKRQPIGEEMADAFDEIISQKPTLLTIKIERDDLEILIETMEEQAIHAESINCSTDCQNDIKNILTILREANI